MDENEAMPAIQKVEGGTDSSAAIKPWAKSGMPSKVSSEVRKRRRNYRFKKLLAPKNPLMILNELKNGLTFEIHESVQENNQSVFCAKVQYEEGKVFVGKGPSKKLAQQAAAEETLKGLFFEKLLEQLPKKETDEHDVDMKPSEDLNADTKETQIPEDDTPWSSLASLAFYKLINEWQKGTTKETKGTAVFPPPTAMDQDMVKSVPGGLRKMPENPTSLDPVMLLHQISPALKFEEMMTVGNDGEHLFTLSIEFCGQQFSGTASKKKEAKKICAKKALATRGIFYS